MPQYRMVVEYKNSHLTRPQLDQIIGAALQKISEVDEVVVRCRSAARTAHRAVEEIAENGHIKNGNGKSIKVILATDEHPRGRA